MALQCPRCELRFDLKPMLADHMATDHDFSPESLAYLQPQSVRVGMPKPKGSGRSGKAGDRPS